MPHVIVKLWPGKSEQQKRRLAQAIADEVMKVLRYEEQSVSVAFEEVDANDWADRDVSAGHRTQGRHPLQETRLHDVTVQ
jgi:4-oxalocrotonate tautomerase